MRIIDAAEFTATRAWGAQDLVRIEDASVRLHWTDQPYRWHVNNGEEVFVVLDGEVDMHHRQAGVESVHRLRPGRICVAEAGDEHLAVPRGAARILVVERSGSV